jgi:hypothetical protein
MRIQLISHHQHQNPVVVVMTLLLNRLNPTMTNLNLDGFGTLMFHHQMRDQSKNIDLEHVMPINNAHTCFNNIIYKTSWHNVYIVTIMSDIKIEIFASAIRYDIEQLQKKTTAVFDVLDHKLELALIEMHDGQTQIASHVNKMWWGTYWSLFMMMVVQTVMFTSLGYYMHEFIHDNTECIRDNAECIRGNADCMTYMKEPAVCEPTPNPMCQTSDSDCYKCWSNIGFKFTDDMLDE